jgi:hypothetical protein
MPREILTMRARAARVAAWALTSAHRYWFGDTSLLISAGAEIQPQASVSVRHDLTIESSQRVSTFGAQ